MKIDKEKLKKLQGLIPCTSSVTFTPEIFAELEEDESMRDFVPLFTCEMFTNEGAEKAKEYIIEYTKGISDKRPMKNKKKGILGAMSKSVKGWSNMYDLSTGEEYVFSSENIENLPELVLESILMELCRYAGIVPRGL